MFFQLFSAFNVISFPMLFPFAFNCTCILSGRFPSWLLLSFHTFSTLYVVFSTSCVLVIIIFPEGYTALYDTETSGKTTITNSYTPGKTSISVEKIWNDNNNQDGKRPESIQVQNVKKKEYCT